MAEELPRTKNGSMERLREEATQDEKRDQVDTDMRDASRQDRKTMKEAADRASSEQGIGEGVKSSGPNPRAT